MLFRLQVFPIEASLTVVKIGIFFSLVKYYSNPEIIFIISIRFKYVF